MGQSMTYRLAPSAELRIQRPPGRYPGELVQFKRADGLEIEVPIPNGVEEGEFFDVDPPAIMVRVPANGKEGDAVTFNALRRDGQEATEWCRALVPPGVAPGKFFVARLTPPLKPQEDSEGSPSSPESSPKKKSSKKKAPSR